MKLTPITSAFPPPVSMESKGNEMSQDNSEGFIFSFSEDEMQVQKGPENKGGENARRAFVTPADWQIVRTERSACQRWTGIGE